MFRHVHAAVGALRLVAPDRGFVLADGQPVQAFRLDSYRARVAHVPQDPVVFATSVRDNIRCGRPHATDAEVRDAARLARFDEVVATLPDGYDTELGPATLSGGQAQRLMLARAAVRDSRIVLLDEPLAGLPSESRPVLAEAIGHLVAGRTTIVVSRGPVAELDPNVVVGVDEGRLVTAETRRRRPGAGTGGRHRSGLGVAPVPPAPAPEVSGGPLITPTPRQRRPLGHRGRTSRGTRHSPRPREEGVHRRGLCQAGSRPPSALYSARAPRS